MAKGQLSLFLAVSHHPGQLLVGTEPNVSSHTPTQSTYNIEIIFDKTVGTMAHWRAQNMNHIVANLCRNDPKCQINTEWG